MAKLIEESLLLKWIWLSLICNPGTKSADRLFTYLGHDVDRIYSATPEEYKQIPHLSAQKIAELSNKDLSRAKEILAYCSNYQIGILTQDHEEYPSRLRMIPYPPLLLYVRGKFPDMEHSFCVAMVGTRTMTEYGQHNTYLMAHGLSKGGAIIVSGIAKGVDGIAHRGCLDAGGTTVAVLGCGVDRCYPPEHTQLMADILRQGAVISEYPPFTPPYGKNFPIRNRIISGLCQATLVTEANGISGALITARDALMQGRDLYALPGKVGEQNSVGVNQLLKHGALPATDALDILKEYQKFYPEKINLAAVPLAGIRSKNIKSPIKRLEPMRQGTAYAGYDQYNSRTEGVTIPKSSSKPAVPRQKPDVDWKKDAALPIQEVKKAPAIPAEQIQLPPLTPKEKEVYDRISGETGISADELTTGSLSVRDVLSAVTTLEIKGLIQALPGGVYIRK